MHNNCHSFEDKNTKANTDRKVAQKSFMKLLIS